MALFYSSKCWIYWFFCPTETKTGSVFEPTVTSLNELPSGVDASAIPCEPFCSDQSPSVDSLIIETSWSIHCGQRPNQMYVMHRVRLMMWWTVGNGSIFETWPSTQPTHNPTQPQPTQPKCSSLVACSFVARCSVDYFPQLFWRFDANPTRQKTCEFFSTGNGSTLFHYWCIIPLTAGFYINKQSKTKLLGIISPLGRVHHPCTLLAMPVLSHQLRWIELYLGNFRRMNLQQSGNKIAHLS